MPRLHTRAIGRQAHKVCISVSEWDARALRYPRKYMHWYTYRMPDISYILLFSRGIACVARITRWARSYIFCAQILAETFLCCLLLTSLAELRWLGKDCYTKMEVWLDIRDISPLRVHNVHSCISLLVGIGRLIDKRVVCTVQYNREVYIHMYLDMSMI